MTDIQDNFNKDDYMTHSTCCKATDKMTECICNDYDGKGVSACGVPCPIHTPPPVPSEIEGEIEKILEHRFFRKGDNDIWDYAGAKQALTALLTHHTSVQVKEEKNKLIKALEKVFDNDMKKTWDKGSEIGAQFAGYARGVLSRAIATAQVAEGEGI